MIVNQCYGPDWCVVMVVNQCYGPDLVCFYGCDKVL